MWMDPLITDESRDRFDRIRINDLGFGYDPFGLNKEAMLRAYTVMQPLYEKYFRVESYGIENLPTDGPCIIASNHTGGLPIDAAMIGLDILNKMHPPRLMRAVIDHFVGGMPYVGLFLSRAGQVIGTRRNFEYLLNEKEMVTVFPEGSKGIVKPFVERYRCRKWNIGFMELHLLHKAPLIPVAVVGAEEQMPILQENKWIGKPLSVPEVPITLNTLLSLVLGPGMALPFPTKYRIYYGEPIEFYKDFGSSTVRSPEMIRELANEVKERVQRMIVKGLAEREGIFY